MMIRHVDGSTDVELSFAGMDLFFPCVPFSADIEIVEPRYYLRNGDPGYPGSCDVEVHVDMTAADVREGIDDLKLCSCAATILARIHEKISDHVYLNYTG